MTVRRYPSGIVGLFYHNKAGTLCRLVATLLRPGDRVELRRDPGNRFDARAVAVFAIVPDLAGDEAHLGFVPARHAGWIGEQLDSGRGLTATVGEIHRDPSGLIVNVDLDVDVERGACVR